MSRSPTTVNYHDPDPLFGELILHFIQFFLSPLYFREAAEHLLTALNQQAAGRGAKGERVTPMNPVMSDSIWSTLRLVLALLDRQDLFPIVEAR